MSSRHRTFSSQPDLPSENEKKDEINQIENNIGSSQDQTFVEPNTKPTENQQRTSLQIPQTSHSEVFTEQMQHPSVEPQQQFSEVFSSEQAQAETERLRLQHPKKRGCEQIFTKTKSGTYWIVTTFESTWYWNPRWTNYTGKDFID